MEVCVCKRVVSIEVAFVSNVVMKVVVFVLTILECVDLFGEDFPNVLLSFVYIIVANRVHDELLELDEFISARGRYLICHLLVVVLKLSDLLQFTDV